MRRTLPRSASSSSPPSITVTFVKALTGDVLVQQAVPRNASLSDAFTRQVKKVVAEYCLQGPLGDSDYGVRIDREQNGVFVEDYRAWNAGGCKVNLVVGSETRRPLEWSLQKLKKDIEVAVALQLQAAWVPTASPLTRHDPRRSLIADNAFHLSAGLAQHAEPRLPGGSFEAPP